MAETAIAAQAVNGPYVLETATQFTTLTTTASDPTNKNKILMTTGKVLVIFEGAAAADYWVTVESSLDAYGREGDITEYDVLQTTWAARIFEPPGWEQTTGGRDLVIDTENAGIKILAIPL